MDFKIFLLLLLITTSQLTAESGSLTCTYKDGWFTNYFCMLHIDNPENLETFDRIEGEHLNSTYSDSNVDTVYGLAAREGAAKVIPSTICDQFENLLFLWLDLLDIESLPNETFTNCRSLKILYLSRNLIENLRPDTFVNNLNLELLDLGKNLLTSLPSEIFTNLRNLTDLYLDGNSFSSLNFDVFNSLSSLQTLWLSNSNIVNLHSNLFTSLEQLEVLELSGNRISFLSNEIFAGNRALKILNLDDNQIQRISALSFSTRMTQFSEFYANQNQIAAIESEFFDLANDLVVVELKENSCIDEEFENFGENREENLGKFKTCFEAAALGSSLRSGFVILCALVGISKLF